MGHGDGDQCDDGERHGSDGERVRSECSTRPAQAQIEGAECSDAERTADLHRGDAHAADVRGVFVRNRTGEVADQSTELDAEPETPKLSSTMSSASPWWPAKRVALIAK